MQRCSAALLSCQRVASRRLFSTDPSIRPPCKVTSQDVLQAYNRIRSVIRKTPLDYSQRVSALTNTTVYFKKEHLSITAAYKERGALNKLLTLTIDERKRGVICSSAGNHAQAVSYHATRLGIDSVIVMPETTPFVKVAATRKFGGKVVLAGSSYDAATQHAYELAKKEGRTFIHAFDDPAVIAGQGTVAVEILEQQPFLDSVIVPIGGGGLCSGMATFLKSVNPRLKVYGVESEAMPGMKVSVDAGKVVVVPKRPSMADGISVQRVADNTFNIIKNCVDRIVLVSEAEIAAGILKLLELEKTVVEGAGAVAFAALLANKLPEVKGQHVAVVLSGGNIDMTLLDRIIEKGLVQDGRVVRVRITVEDKPGQLALMSAIFAKMNANVRDLRHERDFLCEDVGYAQPVFTLETRDSDHVHEIIQELKKNGFTKIWIDQGGDHVPKLVEA